MDNQINVLYHLFTATIDDLRHTRLSSNEAVEVLLFFVLWKYSSDSQSVPEDLMLHRAVYDLPNKENFALIEKVIRALNSKYQDPYHVVDIKPSELKSVLPKIINRWQRNHLRFDLSKWDKANLEGIFNWINNYLGANLFGASEFFTPNDVVSLLSHCVSGQGASNIYDPFCRSGNLLETLSIKTHGSKGFGVTKNLSSYRLAKVHSLLLNSHVIISTEYENQTDNKFDLVVTNPPFNVPEYDALPVIGEWSRMFQNSKSDIAFLAHSIDSLIKKGKCAIIMPNQILSGAGVNKRVRTQLIGENLLECIITLPSRLFYGTTTSAVILFIAKGRKRDKVTMIDASSFGDNGRVKNTLQQDDIDKIVTLYRDPETNEKSKKPNIVVVSLTEIIDQDFDLRFNTFNKRSTTPIYRSSKIILEEINDLEKRLGSIQQRYKETILRKKHLRS